MSSFNILNYENVNDQFNTKDGNRGEDYNAKTAEGASFQEMESSNERDVSPPFHCFVPVQESPALNAGYLDHCHYSNPSDGTKREYSASESDNVKRKSRLSDVTEESSNFSASASFAKKRRADETPNQNDNPSSFFAEESGTGIQSTSHFNDGSISFSGGLPVRDVARSNSYGMFLGSNQSASPRSFYSINNARNLLGNNDPTSADVLLATAQFAGVQNESPQLQPQIMSGMTPLPFNSTVSNTFAYSNNSFVHPEGSFHPIVQVVSSDSQPRNNNILLGNEVILQQPKKWVRWGDDEDRYLRMAVRTVGENNFRLISESYFHGTRTELQCKNRWKKALQPGLIKGRWTKEEDNIITECVKSGNKKWSEIAKMIPGRIGEQVKERWINELDPYVKRGVWSDEEMRILISAQKELGNRWSDIATRIPGRSENSVKNRWYNQKTSDRRAAKKMKEHGAKSSPESTVYSRNSEYEYAELNDEMAQPNHPCGDLNEQKNSSDDAQLIFGSTDTDV